MRVTYSNNIMQHFLQCDHNLWLLVPFVLVLYTRVWFDVFHLFEIHLKGKFNEIILLALYSITVLQILKYRKLVNTYIFERSHQSYHLRFIRNIFQISVLTWMLNKLMPTLRQMKTLQTINLFRHTGSE